MPRIQLEDFTAKIYLEDHHPPHVHVENARKTGEVKVRLDHGGKSEAISQGGKISKREVKRAEELVRENEAILWATWEDIQRRKK